MPSRQIQEYDPVTIQIDESQTFLTVKDAKQIVNTIWDLQTDTKKILELVSNMDRMFNPKIDGEKGLMVRLAAYDADIEFLKKFVYGGMAIYGFIMFCLGIYVAFK